MMKWLISFIKNRTYNKIVSDSARWYKSMNNKCQVRMCTEVWRRLPGYLAVRWLHDGGTMAAWLRRLQNDMVNRWHCGTLTRWNEDQWLGCTVTRTDLAITRHRGMETQWRDLTMARMNEDIIMWRIGCTVKWGHGDVETGTYNHVAAQNHGKLHRNTVT